MKYLIVKPRGSFTAIQVARRVSRRFHKLEKPTIDEGDTSNQMFDVMPMGANRAAILFKPKYFLRPHKDRDLLEMDGLMDDLSEATPTDADKLTRRERLKAALVRVEDLVPGDVVIRSEQWMIDNGFVEA